MSLIVVHPVLVIPGEHVPESDVIAFRKAIPALQAWWAFMAGEYLLFTDPKSLSPAPPWDWFTGYPGGPTAAAKQLPYTQGHMNAGELAVVFLSGIGDWHGEASNRVAVVSYQVVERLATAEADGVPTAGDEAAGLVMHETGHLRGLGHLDVRGELMDGWGTSWRQWPGVALSVRPTAAEPATE